MIFYLCILIFSILIHEFGHLLTSLFFHVKVRAYSIGFGPILLHKKWKGIDWRLSLLPLGGYCDIDEDINSKNSLANIAYWKTCVILLSGVFLNISLAIICYLIQFQSIRIGVHIDLLVLKYAFMRDYQSLAYVIILSKANLYLVQISFLNLILFLTNIIPIPALDGGYLWLMPLRKKLGENIYKNIIHYSFWSLMILQVLLLIYWWVL